ncbi:MAG: hypothetical protein ACD_58C00287G0008 [uncultured bacterium]|nr:MAG: hypothetical protein ACD_58C00287G0008 [uncultured bacterium]
MNNQIVKASDLIQDSAMSSELYDFITEKPISNKPENREAKVPFEKRLVAEYGYNKTDIEPEFRIQHGHHTIGPADIVVFYANKPHIQENIYIIIECKKKDSKEGEAQLKSYLSPCKTAKYGVWFNGNEAKYFKVLDKDPHWREILNIPTVLEQEGLTRKADLKPIVDLNKLLEPIHHKIYADGGLSSEEIFDEIIKLMFAKIADEKDTSTPSVSFGISDTEEDAIETNTSNDFRARIEDLFDKVKRRYKDLFDENEKIKLKTPTLAYIAAQFENLSFKNTERDIKAAAFQKFVYAHQRGERGQFFTPDPIIKLAVNIIDPSEDEMVIDPACGTGGFLVATMKHVWQKIEKTKDDNIEKNRRKLDYARDKIRGIDISKRLAKVTKMRMILEDDGHTGIFSADSLASFATIQKEAIESNATAIQPGTFDIVLTNPPFGSKGKVTSKNILDEYDLGHKWKLNEVRVFEKTNITTDQVPDILFIERCLELLKNGGRTGIVLPDGDITNSTLAFLRQYIKDKAKILAVISLPKETFIPHGTGVKASIIFLQKLDQELLEKEKKKDYQIFFGIVEKIGYDGDKRGTPLYKRNDNSELILDENGEPILDEDVTEVVKAWQEYKENNL